MLRPLAIALLGSLALVLGSAGGPMLSPAPAAAPKPCPGDPIDPDRVIAGSFGSELQGSFVQLPFRVPAGTTAVRVKYCYDQPEAPTSAAFGHTLDIGLFGPRGGPSGPWGMDEFRGWSGSGYSDVTVSPEGFSSDRRWQAGDRVPGRTTRSYRPGPIDPGRWAVELGLAEIVPLQFGDLDDQVSYRVEIALSERGRFGDDPYRPPRYDSSPARNRGGWYAGDLHVHGEHSGDADASMEETFDFAFAPLRQGGAGLDFITLSDHNTDSAWPEIGRLQGRYPQRLVARSQEVTTYLGHANTHATGQVADYRTGAIQVRRRDGSLERTRRPRPPRRFLRAAKRAGGFTQINHPTIFPSPGPAPAVCRGCPWEYPNAATGYPQVDAIEIATGPSSLEAGPNPGPNPFTLTAIEFWEAALDAGHRLAAVGASDSHRAGRVEDATQAPVGEATTVVRASELSERGIREGIEAGHTYVKVTGNRAPDLRFKARRAGSQRTAIMGDAIDGSPVRFEARVLGAGPAPGSAEPDPHELLVIKDGEPLRAVPVTSDDFSHRFRATEAGRYRLQLQRSSTIEALSSPIYVEAARTAPPTPGDDGRDGGGRRGNDTEDGSRVDHGGRPADRAAPSSDGRPRGEVGEPDTAGETQEAGGTLPFSGMALVSLGLAGAALAVVGFVVRRRSSGSLP